MSETSLLLTGEALMLLAALTAVCQVNQWLQPRRVKRMQARRRAADYRLPPMASHLMPWRGKHAAERLRRPR